MIAIPLRYIIIIEIIQKVHDITNETKVATPNEYIQHQQQNPAPVGCEFNNCKHIRFIQRTCPASPAVYALHITL